MRKLLSLLIFFLFQSNSNAQEFNCKATVIAPQVANQDPRIYKSLENAIMQFMNTRRWTNFNYGPQERIDCNFLITVSSQPSIDRFEGSMQVNYSRPVFGTDYLSPVFEIVDNDVSFQFLEGTQIEFTPDRYISALSSLMGFYAYFLLGADADTYRSTGGSDLYGIAQQIVSNAQNASEPGWKGSEGNTTNRFWLIDNQLQAVFRPFRELLYTYHRQGFDQMGTDPANARKAIAAGIEKLRTVHQAKPSSYNLQVFFNAKYNELVNLYKPADPQEKGKILNTLTFIDPGHIQQYQKMVAGS
ncbi:MAG: DUF4835 family protein [Flavobacteriales bacterium]|nr:DUF4835 family protein [Flavobacteriales bacterium]